MLQVLGAQVGSHGSAQVKKKRLACRFPALISSPVVDVCFGRLVRLPHQAGPQPAVQTQPPAHQRAVCLPTKNDLTFLGHPQRYPTALPASPGLLPALLFCEPAVLDLTPHQTLVFPLIKRIHTDFRSAREIPISTVLLIADCVFDGGR